jgi:Fic family protein
MAASSKSFPEPVSNGRWVSAGAGSGRTRAFIPHPLPPRIEWSEELASWQSAADRAISRLAGIAIRLPNPRLLIGPLKRREAVLSSRIEGTQASLDDLLFFEASPVSDPAVPDVREVINYVRALDFGLERQLTLPMSKRLICEMHAILMDGVRGQERSPGFFRTTQNWIGTDGSPIENAIYVPPPPAEMSRLLDDLERYIQSPSRLPPLIRLAAIHYQFEAIHPFGDGNGRIGRLLISILLCMEAVLPAPVLYLSAYFERHRQQYYARLLAVSVDGDWNGWIRFFLIGVAEEAMDAVSRIDRLLSLRTEYQSLFLTARRSALLVRLIDLLFDTPAITVSQAAKFLGVTSTAAQKNIDRLIEHSILREATGNQRNRIYRADAIIRVVNENLLIARGQRITKEDPEHAPADTHLNRA